MNVKKYNCWCLSIIELKNAWWNIEITKKYFSEMLLFCYFEPFVLVWFIQLDIFTPNSKSVPKDNKGKHFGPYPSTVLSYELKFKDIS